MQKTLQNGNISDLRLVSAQNSQSLRNKSSSRKADVIIQIVYVWNPFYLCLIKSDKRAILLPVFRVRQVHDQMLRLSPRVKLTQWSMLHESKDRQARMYDYGGHSASLIATKGEDEIVVELEL